MQIAGSSPKPAKSHGNYYPFLVNLALAGTKTCIRGKKGSDKFFGILKISRLTPAICYFTLK